MSDFTSTSIPVQKSGREEREKCRRCEGAFGDLPHDCFFWRCDHQWNYHEDHCQEAHREKGTNYCDLPKQLFTGHDLPRRFEPFDARMSGKYSAIYFCFYQENFLY
jgi:hypothetical protein